MIGRAFELTTDLFESVTPGAHFINRRCFGEDFAEWFRVRLQARGLSSSEPIQEDWGWVLMVAYAGRQFTLGMGVMDESIGSIPAEWRVDVSFEKPMNRVREWFRAPPHAELAELTTLVGEILRAEERMRNIVDLGDDR